MIDCGEKQETYLFYSMSDQNYLVWRFNRDWHSQFLQEWGYLQELGFSFLHSSSVHPFPDAFEGKGCVFISVYASVYVCDFAWRFIQDINLLSQKKGIYA